ncbi:transcription-repair coupling factor [Buchnera aphidicola]|uniref:transcription-repair coupling factor n=1 Tax=Buchnera aphidicola TaxID=9 RepID=UPI00094D39BE
MKKKIDINTNQSNFSTLMFKKKKYFKKNQLVVHIKYGIGKYIGLCTLNNNGIVAEYFVILYAKKAKLYVPITSLELISTYTNAINSNISLDILGHKKWLNECNQIKKKIYDIAARLIDIKSNRSIRPGFSFKKNFLNYKYFCNQCLYSITQDQKKSIKEIIEDMSKPIPMDRLLCGDVGFGKTEVAMRAAFIALDNKKQVAILVPTTLLAQQHFDTFTNRFSKYTYVIDVYSRFTTIKSELIIRKKIKNNLINILIGTHKILSKNLVWSDLGLLIIDEEHRFGVYHKEQIKELYTNIDVLTLTATPIPRTLNMSYLGMKDISVISTPPNKRLEIKTFIKKFDSEVIRAIILKELRRGGQVYYVYNIVHNIEEKKKYLCHLIPEARIQISHGKMHSKDLRKIMHDFFNKQFDVLICTTIIDTGIHISNVNTMIIENADKFGLSQLHQLRGRIGRSERQAYAFFLISETKKIHHTAQKRLNIVKSFTNLGSGFMLSTHDSEIRGVGELLGKNQSGHIDTIGLELYKKFLDAAMKNITANKGQIRDDELFQVDKDVDLQLNVSAILPETYIYDVDIRLILYKKISCVKNKDQLIKIKRKIYNAFGVFPDSAENLFSLMRIKLLAKKIGIKKIQFCVKRICIVFSKKNLLNTIWLYKKIVKQPNKWKIYKYKLYIYKCFINDILLLKWIKCFLRSIIENRLRDSR